MNALTRCCWLVLMVCQLAFFSTAATAAPRDGELAGLAAAVDAQWNARDAAALSAFYAADATLSLGRDGPRLAGRAQIQAYFEQSLARVAKDLSHRTVLRRVEPLDGQTYLTDNAIYVERPGANGAAEVVGEFFTLTIVRPAASGWEIVAVRAVPLSRTPARAAAG